MEITDRQKDILFAIIEAYIEKCVPISSKEIVDKYFDSLSSATVRAEMAHLEKQGFLISPHTSAGRIPTQSAYEFYVNHTNFTGSLEDALQQELNRAVSAMQHDDRGIRIVAKEIANILDACVIIVFSKYDHYYTGISHLLTKPDFSNPSLLYNISEIIDQLDQILPSMYQHISDDIQIIIGEQNPLSKLCSVMTVQIQDCRLLLLTPIRTDYVKQYQLLSYIKQTM